MWTLVVLCFWAQALLHTTVHGLRIQGSSLVDSNGQNVQLYGFNSFGMNNQRTYFGRPETMLDGMWSNNPLSGDFATVVRRQKLLGFNAVRLPFSFKDFDLAPRSFVHQNCPLPSDEEVAASVTPPGSAVRGPAPRLPNPPPASSYAGDVCNAYLPAASVRDRLMYIVKFYIENGFVVMLDNHLREDQTALENPEKWLAQWTSLAKDLMADPLVRENLIIDLLNEPDNYGVSWDTLTGLYISAMDSIDRAVGGNVMFAVEGTGQSGLNANWGDGFATERVEELGLQDPKPFFNKLLTKPYRDRVILAPHVYPASVTFNEAGTTGNALYERLELSFGGKSKDGYCNGNDCQVFPIAIGEFGSKLEEARDITMMNDFSNYMTDTTRRFSWFWWSWQANSGDTGGLVDNGWLNIVWKKIDLLEKFGLEPWYGGSRDGGYDEPISLPPTPPQPSPEPVPPPSQSPTPTPPIVPPVTIEPPPAQISPTPVPLPPISYAPVPPAPSSSSCAVRVEYTPTWPLANGYYGAVLNVFVSNTGDQVIETPWRLELKGDVYNQVMSAWNWDPTVVDGAISGAGSAPWLALQPNANEYNIGLIIRGTSGTSADYIPTVAVLNGVDCDLSGTSRIAR